jgi:hypothetical protein
VAVLLSPRCNSEMPYERPHRASHQTFALRGAEVGKWRYLHIPLVGSDDKIPPFHDLLLETLKGKPDSKGTWRLHICYDTLSKTRVGMVRL